MKLKILLVMVMLFAAACSPDADTTDGLVDATQDQTNSGTATTLADGETDPETGSSVTLADGENDDGTPPTKPPSRPLSCSPVLRLRSDQPRRCKSSKPTRTRNTPFLSMTSPPDRTRSYYTKFVVEKDGRRDRMGPLVVGPA